MANNRSSLLVAALMALVALSSSAQAQWGDPFARLDYRVTPACPFDCDSVFLVLSGELTSTSWKPPELMSWDQQGDSISIYIRVAYDPDATLPVTVPFELIIPLEELPEGPYRVVYIVEIDNPISEMPTIPFVIATDAFRVAPPGDQNCDGILDVRDVVDIILYVFRGGDPPDPVRRADVNCDGKADIADVVRLIYHVFRGGSICDPCQPSTAQLIGDWRWVRAFGGIAGMERTPETEGYTETVTYRADGIFELRRDGVLQFQVPYTLRTGSPEGFPSGTVVDYGDDALISQLILEVSGDSLRLMDLCWDCFEWTYVRE